MSRTNETVSALANKPFSAGPLECSYRAYTDLISRTAEKCFKHQQMDSAGPS
jgi:hypothetical protein